jgi:hypothetical protein
MTNAAEDQGGTERSVTTFGVPRHFDIRLAPRTMLSNTAMIAITGSMCMIPSAAKARKPINQMTTSTTAAI